MLIHGFTDTWRTWTPLLPTLEARHDVIVLNLPGHLGSDGWDDSAPLSIAALLDWAEVMLDDLGLRRVHLAGSSLGGWLSLGLAARGRALSVVGVCPAGGWDPGGPEVRSVARFFRTNTRRARLLSPIFGVVASRPALREVALGKVVARPAGVSSEAALTMMRGARGCTIVDRALALLDAGDPFGEPGPIDCPVRILYGTADRVLLWPGHYQRMRRVLPDAEWVALDGLGHLPMWDDPLVVANAILAVTSIVG